MVNIVIPNRTMPKIDRLFYRAAQSSAQPQEKGSQARHILANHPPVIDRAYGAYRLTFPDGSQSILQLHASALPLDDPGRDAVGYLSLLVDYLNGCPTAAAYANPELADHYGNGVVHAPSLANIAYNYAGGFAAAANPADPDAPAELERRIKYQVRAYRRHEPKGKVTNAYFRNPWTIELGDNSAVTILPDDESDSTFLLSSRLNPLEETDFSWRELRRFQGYGSAAQQWLDQLLRRLAAGERPGQHAPK